MGNSVVQSEADSKPTPRDKKIVALEGTLEAIQAAYLSDDTADFSLSSVLLNPSTDQSKFQLEFEENELKFALLSEDSRDGGELLASLSRFLRSFCVTSSDTESLAKALSVICTGFSCLHRLLQSQAAPAVSLPSVLPPSLPSDTQLLLSLMSHLTPSIDLTPLTSYFHSKDIGEMQSFSSFPQYSSLLTTLKQLQTPQSNQCLLSLILAVSDSEAIFDYLNTALVTKNEENIDLEEVKRIQNFAKNPVLREISEFEHPENAKIPIICPISRFLYYGCVFIEISVNSNSIIAIFDSKNTEKTPIIRLFPSGKLKIRNNDKIDTNLTYTESDKIGIFIDLEGNKVKFYKNGAKMDTEDIEYVGKKAEIGVILRAGGKCKVLQHSELPADVPFAWVNDRQNVEYPEESPLKSLFRSLNQLSESDLQVISHFPGLSTSTFGLTVSLSPSILTNFANFLHFFTSNSDFSLAELILPIIAVNLSARIKTKTIVSQEILDILTNFSSQNSSFGHKCADLIVKNLDLFHPTASSRLSALINAVNNPENRLETELISKFSDPVELISLLKQVQNDEFSAFQTLISAEKPPKSLILSFQKSLFYLHNLNSADVFLSNQLISYSKSVFFSLISELNSYQIGGKFSQISENLSLFLSVGKINAEIVAKLTPVILDVLNALKMVKIPELDVKIVKKEGKTTVATVNPESELIVDIEIPEKTTRIQLNFPENPEILVRIKGEWVKSPGDISNPENLAVKITAKETEIASFDLTWESYRAEIGETQRNVDKMKMLVSSIALHHAESLISGAIFPKSEVGSELEKALDSKLVQSGIKEDAWKLLDYPIELPKEMEELFLAVVEPFEPTDVPTYQRSVSMMTPAQYHSESPNPESDLLSSYFHSVATSPPATFTYDNSLFLENLIEGKGSAASLWLRIRKHLNLDKRPASNVGGSDGDRTERSILALFLKALRVVRDVESLTSDTENIPEIVPLLWKEAVSLRIYLSQKQQDMSKLRTNVQQLCVLLLQTDIPSFLTHSGVLKARQKESNLPVSLQALKKLGSKGGKGGLEDYKQALLTVSEFIKAGVDVTDFAKAIETRRNHAVSRIIGYALLSILLTEFQQKQAVETFTRTMNGHYLLGLSGIDPTLRRCLRKQFFTLWEEVLMQVNTALQTRKMTEKQGKECVAMLQGLVFPLKTYDYDTLNNLPIRPLASALLRSAQGHISLYSPSIDSRLCVTGFDSDCTPLYSGKTPVIAVKVGEKEPGWSFVEGQKGCISFLSGEGEKYLVGWEDEKGPVFAAKEILFTHEPRPDSLLSLQKTLQTVSWIVFKHFFYSISLETHHSESLESQLITLLTEQIKKIDTEKCPFAITKIADLPSGTLWNQQINEISYTFNRKNEEMNREVDILVRKFEFWKENCGDLKVETVKKLEKDEKEMELWRDESGNCSLEARFGVILRDEQASETVKENVKSLMKRETGEVDGKMQSVVGVSLLWLLQMAPSWGSQRLLGVEDVKDRLLSLAFGANSTLSSLAFRVLRSSFIHSKADIPFPTVHPLVNTITESTPTDMCTALLHLIAVSQVNHITWRTKPCSVSRTTIQTLSNESLFFLLSTLPSLDCQLSLLTRVQDTLKSFLPALPSSSWPQICSSLFTLIGFFTLLYGQRSNSIQLFKPVANSTLKGIITAISDEKITILIPETGKFETVNSADFKEKQEIDVTDFSPQSQLLSLLISTLTDLKIDAKTRENQGEILALSQFYQFVTGKAVKGVEELTKNKDIFEGFTETLFPLLIQKLMKIEELDRKIPQNSLIFEENEDFLAINESFSDINNLFKLSKNVEFRVISSNSRGKHVINTLNQHYLWADGPAEMEYQWETGVLKGAGSVCEAVTVMLAIGVAGERLEGVVGGRVAGVEVELEGGEKGVRCRCGDKVLFEEVGNKSSFSVAVSIRQSGKVTVQSEGRSEELSIPPPGIYQLFTHPVTIYTRSSSSVVLRGLSLFEGITSPSLPFYKSTDSPPLTDPIPTDPRQVFLSLQPSQPLLPLSRLTGSLSSASIYDQIDAVLSHSNPALLPIESVTVSDLVIEEVCLFDSTEEVPDSFIIAEYWKNGGKVGNTGDIPGLKIIAYRKVPIHLAKQVLTAFYLQPNTESSPGMLTIGNIWKDPDLKSCLYVISKPIFTGLKGKITDFILFEADNEEKIDLPAGCSLAKYLTGKEKPGTLGCPVLNLAQNGQKVMFLAAKMFDLVDNFPLESLLFSNSVSENGKKPSNSLENTKKSLSLAEKKVNFYLFERQSEAKMARNVLKTLGIEAYWELAGLLSEYDVFKRLIYAFNEEKEEVKKVIQAVMKGNETVQSHVLKYGLWQVLNTLYQPLPVSEQPPVFVESLHPYENNMNYDQSYIIPGALKLLIEFTPETKTEGNCDVLTFYKGPNHTDQICAYSGECSNFKPLEIEGDRVFIHFRSDGSVVFWGYAFTITAVSGVTETTPIFTPDYPLLNPELGLWMLEESFIPTISQQTISRLLLYLLHFPRSNVPQSRVLTLLTRLQSCDLGQIWALLASEGRSLYRLKEKIDEVPKVLQAIMVTLPMEALQNWADSFLDLRFALRCLSTRNQESDAWLLGHLLKEKVISHCETVESEHPYAIRPHQMTVSFPGIHRYTVETSPDCVFDPGHDLFIGSSFSPSAYSPSTTNILFPSEISFTPSSTASTMSLSEHGQTLTSSNNNWGLAVLDKELGLNQWEITYFIVTTSSENFGFGVTIHKNKFETNACGLPGNGFSSEYYCYNANGYIDNTETSVSIRQGHRITILMNEKREIIFKNNGKTLGNPIIPKSRRLRLYVTAYGNQKFSIESYKDTSNPQKLVQNRLYDVISDQICISYPVNKAYSTVYEWNSGGSTIKMTENVWKIHLISPQMQSGINIFHVKLLNLGENEVQVGVIAEGEPLDQPLTDTNAYSLSNFGVAYVNSVVKPGKRFGSQDKVTVIWDLLAGNVRFEVNGEEVVRKQLSKYIGKKSFSFAVALSSAGQSAEILPCPSDSSLFTLDSPEISASWGLKLSISPQITQFDGLQLLSRLSPGHLSLWEQEKSLHGRFSKSADTELVALLDKQSIKTGKSPLSVASSDLDLSAEARVLYTELEKFSEEELGKRVKVMQEFNRCADAALEMVDLENACSETQKEMLICKGWLFYAKKSEKLKSVLDQTAGGSTPTISVNRIRANFMRKKGVKDGNCKISVFAQVMASVMERAPKDLWVSDRAFRVDLMGEGATDAGGPYNEIISTMCEELMSDFLPLFIPSPNNSHNTGLYRDAYIVNPDATSSLHMSMFYFLGLLFGIAIRTQNNLALTFPPLFWKRVSEEPIDLQDLKTIDLNSLKALELLRDPKSQNLSLDDFQQLLSEFNFTTKNSAGREICLIPDGKRTIVTLDRVNEYADLIENLRLTENIAAYAKIREGLGAIVPLNLLFLLSWSQIETLICGSPVIDVDRLRENTSYDGYSKEDAVIVNFWEVFTEMNDEQRSAFLRFAWGRARLPASGSFRQFQITRYSCENSDQYLPLSHTCFFTIDLPPYTTKEILKNKLMYSITHCQSIDNDHDADAWNVEE